MCALGAPAARGAAGGALRGDALAAALPDALSVAIPGGVASISLSRDGAHCASSTSPPERSSSSISAARR